MWSPAILSSILITLTPISTECMPDLSRIMVLSVDEDMNKDTHGQLYAPPPHAVIGSSVNNFGLRPYPHYAPVYCNGLVYTTGGAWDLHDPTDWVQIYNPRFGNTTWTQPMDDKRSLHSAVCLNRTIIVCGGYGWKLRALSKCERFDTATKQWSPIADMPCANAEHKAVVLGNHMYIIGGSSYCSTTTSPLLRYDPTENKWERLEDSLMIHQYTFGVVAIESLSSILVCGDLSTWKQCELYKAGSDNGTATASGTWTRMAPMVHARLDFGMAMFEDRILIFGGKCKESKNYFCPDGTPSYMNQVEEYDVSRNISSLVNLALYSSGPCYANVVIPEESGFYVD